jgi:hypothetical protein
MHVNLYRVLDGKITGAKSQMQSAIASDACCVQKGPIDTAFAHNKRRTIWLSGSFWCALSES